MAWDEEAERERYEREERRRGLEAFKRTETRHTKLKRLLDCGCWIDGGEPYIYSVWKLWDAERIEQVLVCEFCDRKGKYH